MDDIIDQHDGAALDLEVGGPVERLDSTGTADDICGGAGQPHFRARFDQVPQPHREQGAVTDYSDYRDAVQIRQVLDQLIGQRLASARDLFAVHDLALRPAAIRLVTVLFGLLLAVESGQRASSIQPLSVP